MLNLSLFRWIISLTDDLCLSNGQIATIRGSWINPSCLMFNWCVTLVWTCGQTQQRIINKIDCNWWECSVIFDSLFEYCLATVEYRRKRVCIACTELFRMHLHFPFYQTWICHSIRYIVFIIVRVHFHIFWKTNVRACCNPITEMTSNSWAKCTKFDVSELTRMGWFLIAIIFTVLNVSSQFQSIDSRLRKVKVHGSRVFKQVPWRTEMHLVIYFHENVYYIEQTLNMSLQIYIA